MTLSTKIAPISFGLGVLAIAAAGACWALLPLTHTPVSAPDSSSSEPVIATPIHPSESPTPLPMPDPDPSPVATAPAGEDPWLTADDGTLYFEDGSWREADGTTGCTEGMPCSEPAPVVVNEAPTLPACEQEDSDNCYWDAATMGNGQGRSFVTLGGVTYYADQPQRRTVTLNGQVLEYVDGSDAILYCDQPLEVGIDVDDLGNQWAGCM